MSVAIIQARMSSTRLPGKVLMNLAGRPVLFHVVSAVRAAGLAPLVCTSEQSSDQAIVDYCEKEGIPWVVGPLMDVTRRFALALEHDAAKNCEWFFRVTADCPLLSASICQKLWDAKEECDDFLGVDQTLLPLGLSAELIRKSSFERLQDYSLNTREREHVTLGMYNRPEVFRCRRINPSPDLAYPELRLTLDYAEDFALLEKLFEGQDSLCAESAIKQLLTTPGYSQLQEAQARAAKV